MPYKYDYAKKRGARARSGKAAKLLTGALAVFSALVLAAIASVQYFSSDGFVEANIMQVSGDSIIIGNNCTAIVATTSAERAQSIEQGISGIMNGRPNTHDTVAQILRSFNITVDAVKFNAYDGRYYYSDMVLHDGSKALTLDMMPSDAIAVALRTNATIYINRTLLSQIGKKVC